MKNALIQTRCVSDPIANPLIGWWLEYFLFYVKLRDIEYCQLPTTPGVPLYPEVESMLLDPNWDFSVSTMYEAAARPGTYKAAGSIDWTYLALRRVVETYFRLQGESFTIRTLDGLPIASLYEDEGDSVGAGWWDSAVRGANVTWDTGINVDLNLDQTITTAEIDQAMRMWQYQLAVGQTQMNFQDYLKQFGITLPVDDLHRPELLRFVRQWQYPSNTVDPLTGKPTSALSWSVAERADKDRFFSEPGFILLLSCARPKIYYKNQSDAAVQMMTNSFAWLPQVFASDPQTSMRYFAPGNVGKTRGPLDGTIVASPGGYWVDIKDLFLYGDNFTNLDRTGKANNIIDAPTPTLTMRYGALVDAQNLFVDNAAAGTLQFIKQDGVMDLNILGTQVDSSDQGQRMQ
jgi:hypothetical protein